MRTLGSIAPAHRRHQANDFTAPFQSGARQGTGQGGGGGATADPVGWLEIGPDGAVFKPIVPAMPSPGFLLASGATAALVLRALAKLLRR